ncbi:MAG: flavodoxin family protein [Elusimicrobiaceae bacterium]|nr:flavodoxin family protein [Elusimicrobiaceae bacterium]
MAKKVLILSGSPRKGGNSDLLCDQFLKGAQEGGHDVEKIFVSSKKIAPCLACYYCQTHKDQCAIKDDMGEIVDKIQVADVLVLASPVYFYSINAQMKAVIDRCVRSWERIANKEFYYIMTAAEDAKHTMDTTLACFRGFADCLEGSKECGVLYGKGAYEKGAIKELPVYEEAYQMGKGV